MTATVARGGAGGAGAAIVIYSATALLIVGSSAPIPLLPLFGENLGLPTSRVALIFSLYFATMVVALGLSGIPAAHAKPKVTLTAALAVSAAADLLLIYGTEPTILIARVLTGFGVGLGLGAGATLAVMLRGDRGRSVSATMTMVASFVGITGSALLADFSPWPTTAPFILHLLLTGAILVLMVRLKLPPLRPHGVAMPPQETYPVRADGASPHEVPAPARPRRRRLPRLLALAGVAIGVVAWSLGNVVVGLGPTLVRDGLPMNSVLGASMMAIMVAGCGIIGQYTVPLSRPKLAISASAWSLLCGLALVVGGTLLVQVWLMVAGSALVGWGQGAGYRTGMLAVTRGLSPQRHGARSSLYAATAYFAAASAVQIGGILMSAFGSQAGMLTALVGIAVPLITVVLGTLIHSLSSGPTAPGR
ncbi:MFS transporter [Citricoccus zhacaiensis]